MRIDGINKNNLMIYPNQKSKSPEPVGIAESTEEKKTKALEKLEEMQNAYETLSREMERIREQGEAMAEETKKRTKCMIIAMRIIAGDEVPVKDHRYLAENDPALYGRALMMRMQRPDPIKHKQISEDEDDPAQDIQEISADGGSESADAEIVTEQAQTAESGGE